MKQYKNHKVLRDKESERIDNVLKTLLSLVFYTKILELAYCIGCNIEVKGLVTKAFKAISNFAYNELNLDIIQIIVHKTNLASVKVAQNNDFVWQRTLINEFTQADELPLNMELYELVI